MTWAVRVSRAPVPNSNGRAVPRARRGVRPRAPGAPGTEPHRPRDRPAAAPGGRHRRWLRREEGVVDRHPQVHSAASHHDLLSGEARLTECALWAQTGARASWWMPVQRRSRSTTRPWSARRARALSYSRRAAAARRPSRPPSWSWRTRRYSTAATAPPSRWTAASRWTRR